MASPNIVELSSDTFSSTVNGGVVVVDFWAPWCGPCRALAPELDKVADQFAGKVKVAKVNVDDEPDLAMKYDVQTIPRVLIFKNSDTPVFEHVGTIRANDLAKVINTHL